MSRIARAIVRLSARLAPRHFRDRWREEWLAELSSVPDIRGLMRALGAPLDAVSAHWTVPPSPHAHATSRPTRSDFVLAFRQIQQAPLLSAAAIAALAVGIGTATLGFAFVVNVFYSQLPVPQPRRIAKVDDFDRVGRFGVTIDYAEFARRQAAASSFAGLAAFNERVALVTAPARSPELRRVAHVTVNLSSVLELFPPIGRDFTPGDVGGAPVALISDRLHERYFDRDPAIVGKVLTVDERPFEIAGVMPPRWRFPMAADVWVPLDPRPRDGATPTASLKVVGRLAEGATFASATQELRTLAAGGTRLPGREHVVQSVVSYTDSIADPGIRYAVWGVVFALVLLLSVSAGNVANIVLARALSRRREIAVRSALGASRARIIVQIAVEAVVLAVIATVLGVLGARAGLAWLDFVEADKPFWVQLQIDWRAAGFITLLAGLAAVVAGVAPALRVTRGSMFEALRDANSSLRFGRVSGILIVCETAVAIALLTGTFVLARGLTGFAADDARLPLDRSLVGQLYFGGPPLLASADAPTDPAVRRLAWREHLDRSRAAQRQLVRALSASADVRAVSVASQFPGDDPRRATFAIRSPGSADREAASRVVYADAAYLDVLRATAMAGRFFTEEDVERARPVAVVNEPFARKYFDGNPLGSSIRIGEESSRGGSLDPPEWRLIIGVIPDLGLNPASPSNTDGVYLPLEPENVIRVGVAAAGPPLALVPVLHRHALALDPRPQVQWTTTMAAQMQAIVTALQAAGLALAGLGGVALLLSCLGTYAIVAFSVAQRRREIAIRVAMGAGPRSIVAAVFAPSARRLLAGTVAGGLLGFGIQRLFGLMPFAIGDGGPWNTAAMVALVTLTGALACAAPIRRALTLRPTDWLKD